MFLWMHFDLMHSSEHKKVVNVLECEFAFWHRTYYEHDWNSIPYSKHTHLEEWTHLEHVGGLNKLPHESGERTWIRMRILASNILRARLELYSSSQTYSCDRMNAFGTRRRTLPALPPCLHFFECELQKLGSMVIEHYLLHLKHEIIKWHVYGFNNIICVRLQVPAPFSTASFVRT